jgi:hypothetical protein
MDDENFRKTIDPIYLQTQLVEFFSLNDLQDLCFKLGLDFDELAGEGKTGKARELVIYCRNRGLLEQLLTEAQKARPNLALLPEAVAAAVSPESGFRESTEQQLYELVKSFNRTRHQPRGNLRTRAGDEIAFQLREFAPQVDGRFDVGAWLDSANTGKRLAAVEFLDWKQDTEFFGLLVDKLFEETPFIQFHILIALNSLLDQLGYEQMVDLRERLKAYDPGEDGSRGMLRQALLGRVDDWFRVIQ